MKKHCGSHEDGFSDSSLNHRNQNLKSAKSNMTYTSRRILPLIELLSWGKIEEQKREIKKLMEGKSSKAHTSSMSVGKWQVVNPQIKVKF